MSKITKDDFSLEVCEDKAEKYSDLLNYLCSTIANGRNPIKPDFYLRYKRNWHKLQEKAKQRNAVHEMCDI